MKEFFVVCIFLFSAPSFAESKACLKVDNMTCPTCSLTVKTAVNQLKGIKEIEVSVDKGEAVVSFDEKLTSAKAIKDKINDIGQYKANDKQCKAP